MSTNEPINVSVVVPVYKSQECVGQLVERVHAAFQKTGRTYELILVNDCSPDDSWARIRELSTQRPEVVGINLRRNTGQDSALMAGMHQARGRVIVIMDDDLQHDPDDAEQLIKKVEAGHDVCFADFNQLKQAWWKNLGSALNGALGRLVLDKPKDLYLSPYKAIDAGVVKELLAYDGPYPYVDGLILRVTRNVTQTPIAHHARFAGRGNYNLRKSISVWLKHATSFSLLPLRIATALGFLFAGIGFALAVAFIILKFLGSQEPYGWASTNVSILILGGIQLASLGIIGEYVGRVYLHLNRTPQYIVKETIGGHDRDAH